MIQQPTSLQSENLNGQKFFYRRFDLYLKRNESYFKMFPHIFENWIDLAVDP